MGNIIQIALWIRILIDSRWIWSLAIAITVATALMPPSQKMASHRLSRANCHFIGVLTHCFFDCSGLRRIISSGTGTVGIDVAHLIRIQPSVLQRQLNSSGGSPFGTGAVM